MDTSVKGLNKWANAHTNYGLDIIRIALGFFLIYKGASFITHSRTFEDLDGHVWEIFWMNPNHVHG